MWATAAASRRPFRKGIPMIDQRRHTRTPESGFTLIELLIVIVILGVLAGVVVFGVSAFNNQGVASSCKSDIENVTVASQAYYAATGGWAKDIPTMVSAGYLHNAPTSTKYTITYTPPTGSGDATVTGTLAGGGNC
jgi:general secretion pathway protein G